MKSSAIIISALLSLAYSAPYQTVESVAAQRQQQQEQAMSGVEGSVTNHQQVMDTLNERLRADGGVHANQERITAYITGADSQIDNAIATVSDALAPFTGGISKAIGNFLLGPFVQSVTNGAEVFVSNVIGNAEDTMDAEMVGRMTGDYSRLIQLSSKNNVDTSRLQDLNEQLTNTLPKAKRDLTAQEIAQRQQQQEEAMSGAQGSITNHQQVVDTLNHLLNQAGGDPHANADRMVAYITGADSQIDNAIATISDALAPFTGGASKAIGNFLLGPFVQSVTNGAEVFLANMMGGAADQMDAALVGQLTGNYSRLIKLSSQNNIDVSKLQNLNQQISKSVN